MTQLSLVPRFDFTIYVLQECSFMLGRIVCWTSKVMVLCWRTLILEHFARRHSSSVKLGHRTSRTGCSRLRRDNSGEITFLPLSLSSSSLPFSFFYFLSPPPSPPPTPFSLPCSGAVPPTSGPRTAPPTSAPWRPRSGLAPPGPACSAATPPPCADEPRSSGRAL